MLDIKFVTENPELVKKAMATRSGTYDVDKVLTLNARRKEILGEVEAMKAERNRVSEEIAVLKRGKQDASEKIAAMKTVGEKIKAFDDELSVVEADLKMAILSIPNIPHESVPVGPDDTCNVEQRRVGEPTKFSFTPPAHWDIASRNRKIASSSTVTANGAHPLPCTKNQIRTKLAICIPR